MENYFEDELVRVDHSSGTSPFTIFFIVCVIGALALFTVGPLEHNRMLNSLPEVHDSQLLSGFISMLRNRAMSEMEGQTHTQKHNFKH